MTEPLEARLLRLAEAATPGPWQVTPAGSDGCPVGDERYVDSAGENVAYANGVRGPQDAAFIAALSPSTVILLARALAVARPLIEQYDDAWRNNVDSDLANAWDDAIAALDASQEEPK